MAEDEKVEQNRSQFAALKISEEEVTKADSSDTEMEEVNDTQKVILTQVEVFEKKETNLKKESRSSEGFKTSNSKLNLSGLRFDKCSNITFNFH